MRELGVVVVLNGKVDGEDLQLVVFKRMDDDDYDYGMITVGNRGRSFKCHECNAEFLRQDIQQYIDAVTPSEKDEALAEVKSDVDNILYEYDIQYKELNLDMETLSSTLSVVCTRW